MKSVRWLVSIFALMAALSSVAVAHGDGGRWSGIDPEVHVNGERINVYVEWPTEYTCEVGNIDITILLPLLGDVEFIGESEEKFHCPDGGETTVKTNTTLRTAMVESVNVIGTLYSSDMGSSLGLNAEDGLSLFGSLNLSVNEFQVNMRVYKNGNLVSSCTGLSNLPIECLPTATSKIGLLNGLF